MKEIRLPNGGQKFSEEALRAEIKKVNMGLLKNFPAKAQYSDERVCEIVQFAKRNDVNLRDVAEFSLLPENTLPFVNMLSQKRFKIFKEFMRYTKSYEFGKLKINQTSSRMFDYNYLLSIAKDMPEDKIKILRKLRDVKLPKGAFVFNEQRVFSGEQLMCLVNAKSLNIDDVANLAKTSGLNGHDIFEMAKVKDMDFKAASKVINRLKKSHNGDAVFWAEKDLYEPDKFRLFEYSRTNDKEVLVKTFDNKMNLISTDKIRPVAGKPSQARITGKDFDVVLEAHSVPTKHDEFNSRVVSVLTETRQIRDKDGNLLRTECLTPSQVEGLHNWKAVMPDGTVKPIIDVKKSKKGIITVTKEMEALDETVTKSKYRKLPDGSWTMRLNISKDGKILSKRNVKHKMISASEAESTVNGQKFRILYSPDEIKVLNSRGDTDFVIDLNSLVDAGNTPENAVKLKNLLKELSADELRVVNRKLKKLEFNPINSDSYARPINATVSTGDNIFTFRHEMGHIDDLFGTGKNNKYHGIYSTAEDFRKIYAQELGIYMKNFPQTQRKYVDYFIDHSDPETGWTSYQETAAELLASNNCPDTDKFLAIRTEYLERYFPKTRSFLLNA